MVARWVAIISISYIPYYPPFDIQTVASPLSLACASEYFFLIALLTLLHRDRGHLVYVCFISEYHEPWAYGRLFLSLFFLLSHYCNPSYLIGCVFSSFFFLCLICYLFCFIFFSTLSGDPSPFITWKIVTSFPLSTSWTLIQKSLVWEGHLVRESFCYLSAWECVYPLLISSLELILFMLRVCAFVYM